MLLLLNQGCYIEVMPFSMLIPFHASRIHGCSEQCSTPGTALITTTHKPEEALASKRPSLQNSGPAIYIAASGPNERFH